MTADQEIKAHWQAIQKAASYGQSNRPQWYPVSKQYRPSKRIWLAPNQPKKKE